MTPSLVLYLALTAATLALCLWAAGTALARGEGHGGSHRAWTLLTAVLLPLVALATALAATPGYGDWMPAAAALPVLVIAATWANATTLRRQSWWLRILHLPVFAFNASLAGIYTVRVVQDLSGIDLGDWGTAITAGHAALQTRVGGPGAFDNPIWLHLPILLPLSLRYRWPHRFALLGCSAIAGGMLAALFATMPAAYHRTQSFRTTPVSEQLLLPPSLGVGTKVPWGDRVLSAEERDAWRAHVLDLGIDHVAVEVTPDSFENTALLDQLVAEVERARSQGLRVFVLTAPPAAYSLVPARDLRELRTAMSRMHWLAAERLRPDLLVLYSGPFGRLSRKLARVDTIEQWLDSIRQSAQEARQANPEVKLAVAIESRGPHSEELFRALKSDRSPVDVVGLDVFPDQLTLGEVRGALRALRRWIERSPGPRPVAILETGACPQTCGGELGQWTLLATVLRFAGDLGLQGVCIDALCDRDTARGLIARDGRQRLAYDELRRSLLLTRTPRPPR